MPPYAPSKTAFWRLVRDDARKNSVDFFVPAACPLPFRLRKRFCPDRLHQPDEYVLSGLDELTALTDSLADISVPKRYADAGIDELAAQAAEHMQEADSLYHEACSAETFDQERASAAQEHYQRAMKRIHYIGIMLQGRTPDDEEITIIHETTDWTGGDLPDTSDGTVE